MWSYWYFETMSSTIVSRWSQDMFNGFITVPATGRANLVMGDSMYGRIGIVDGWTECMILSMHPRSELQFSALKAYTKPIFQF